MKVTKRVEFEIRFWRVGHVVTAVAVEGGM